LGLPFLGFLHFGANKKAAGSWEGKPPRLLKIGIIHIVHASHRSLHG